LEKLLKSKHLIIFEYKTPLNECDSETFFLAILNTTDLERRGTWDFLGDAHAQMLWFRCNLPSPTPTVLFAKDPYYNTICDQSRY